MLRSLGKEGELKIEVKNSPIQLKPGDSFLLCTDGFWEYVTELEMLVHLAKAKNPGAWLSMMEDKILERAKNEFDNYSAIGIFVEA